MSTFQNIKNLRPGRSVFNLSYSKLFDCNQGELITIMADEMEPGDSFKIGNEVVVRLQPLVSPVLHEINVYVHYFFVPYRILWDGWETFITGGIDGDDVSNIPRWESPSNTKWSLWDYLGFPIGIDPDGAYPVVFPPRAYNMIYNEYYRDQNQITEVSLSSQIILKRAWEKDYFTASLPWQQRGTAPALPISGTIEATGIDRDVQIHSVAQATPRSMAIRPTGTDDIYASGYTGGVSPLRWSDPSVQVDLEDGVTFDVNDLRLAYQLQKWLERNARAGVRYTEFLKAHFGVAPRDERLQRPEYIGGSKSPIIVSEVMQTSATGLTGGTTEQGNLAGHGITADMNYCGKYRASEFGLIMGILSIMPRTQYSQGINRQWLRETRYDYYFPEFAHLSEQAITQAELYATDILNKNTTIFGYVGRYDEMRVKMNMAVGSMAAGQDLAYWTLAREFASDPVLGQTFLECNGSTVSQSRIFAHGTTAPGFIVHIGNKITAVRPLPIEGNPI